MPTYYTTSGGGLLNGSSKNDTIYGGAGADELHGLDGKDDIFGGANNDVLYGGEGNDVLDGGTGNDVLDGGKGSDALAGGDGTDTLSYASATEGVALALYATDVNGLGQQYASRAAGGFVGDASGDSFSGFELFVGSSYRDYVGGAAIGMTYNLGAGDDVFDTNYTLTVRDVVFGETGNDVMWSGGGDDLVYGGLGADYLYGEDGNDVLNGGAAGDYVGGGVGMDTADYADSAAGVIVNLATGSASGGDAQGDVLNSIEYLNGSAFNDVLTGNAGNNAISGNSGSDILAGGAGSDVLDGGDGADTADYVASAAAVTVNLATGTGVGGDAQGDVLSTIENINGSAFNDVLTGNSAVNVLKGNGGADVLSGGVGADALDGGDGSDTADYSTAAAAMIVNLSNGLSSDGDVLVAIENVTGSAFADVLVGNAGANVLNGGAGNDYLAGYGGADSLVGGDGSDTANYSASEAAVVVNLYTGSGSGGDALGDTYAGVENVSGSAFADWIAGDNGANILAGNDGNDVLSGFDGADGFSGGKGDDRIYGGAAADYIDGGEGTDTADYRYSVSAVTVSLVTNTGAGGEAEGDALANIENLSGSNFDDVLTGNEGVNRLVGNQGSDQLYGMGGNDMFDTGGGYDFVDGGAGIDTVTYDDSWGLVVVNLATGIGSGAEAAGDFLVNVENVTGSLFDDRLTGDAGINQLTGLDGNDVLDGGAGNDYLVGGLGADTLIGGAGDQDVADYDDAASGVIVNLVTGGTGGEAAGDTFSGVEYVYGSDFNDQITGDAAVNRLLGNDGDDMLDGGAGNDILIGGNGADTLVGGLGDQDAASYQLATSGVSLSLVTGGTAGEAAGDSYNGIEYVYGSTFNDTIIGDAAINRLVGGAGNDALDGAGGNDYLLGDAGNDTMIGGAGADVFVLNAGFGNDTISDFWFGAGRTDRIWFQGAGFANYADVLAHAADTTAGVLITAAGQGQLLLSGVTIAQLNADDFLFG